VGCFHGPETVVKILLWTSTNELTDEGRIVQ
jgi:hypothetical protein